uniref:Uncharacterized protein n=1 Tax=Cacopsylla melanoneura TaxID=428564 RepID=A0A8D9AB57_9HEMI
MLRQLQENKKALERVRYTNAVTLKRANKEGLKTKLVVTQLPLKMTKTEIVIDEAWKTVKQSYIARQKDRMRGLKAAKAYKRHYKTRQNYWVVPIEQPKDGLGDFFTATTPKKYAGIKATTRLNVKLEVEGEKNFWAYLEEELDQEPELMDIPHQAAFWTQAQKKVRQNASDKRRAEKQAKKRAREEKARKRAENDIKHGDNRVAAMRRTLSSGRQSA